MPSGLPRSDLVLVLDEEHGHRDRGRDDGEACQYAASAAEMRAVGMLSLEEEACC